MKYRCVIMRGGTSKGIFLEQNDLPTDPLWRDKVILRVFGSPDKRQVDGLGGAEMLTSKLAIIGPPSRADADVDFTFGQVGIGDAAIDWGNCGNLSAAVGPYAIEEGYVKAPGDMTTVRIFNTGTGKMLYAHVPTSNGLPQYKGDFSIDGVPGTGAKIIMDYSNTAGAMTGKLLPTGRVRDTLNVPGMGDIDVSFVDCSNPAVFVRMEVLGLEGTESPVAMENDQVLVAKIEAIRKAAAKVMNIHWDDANPSAQLMPMLISVREPRDYRTFTTNTLVRAEDVDFVARSYAAGVPHKAFGGTTSVCASAAARIEGTVLWDTIAPERRNKLEVIIGHGSGRMINESEVQKINGEFVVTKAHMFRTARRILEGQVYVDLDLPATPQKAA